MARPFVSTISSIPTARYVCNSSPHASPNAAQTRSGFSGTLRMSSTLAFGKSICHAVNGVACSLLGILFGSAMVFIPVVGHVIILGPLAAMIFRDAQEIERARELLKTSGLASFDHHPAQREAAVANPAYRDDGLPPQPTTSITPIMPLSS
jgi:hypothetical protein